jgi:flagellum-specific peptidoglycan hydrolase FlgJ
MSLVVSDPPRSEATNQYIEQFARLAVMEMHRSGVPASITLAQGIHESQSGQSPLARKANNHFGIKCKSYWNGPTYLHKDDDRNARGHLIASCFRAYDSAVDSYIDHSDFLSNRSYYQELFDYPLTDYKAWAKGLKSCGYATDPQYAEILIRIIETYELHRFDKFKLNAKMEFGTVLDTTSNYNRMRLKTNQARMRYMDY